jgi:hypothetical protein
MPAPEDCGSAGPLPGVTSTVLEMGMVPGAPIIMDIIIIMQGFTAIVWVSEALGTTSRLEPGGGLDPL